jgi:hypothetical protein
MGRIYHLYGIVYHRMCAYFFRSSHALSQRPIHQIIVCVRLLALLIRICVKKLLARSNQQYRKALGLNVSYNVCGEISSVSTYVLVCSSVSTCVPVCSCSSAYAPRYIASSNCDTQFASLKMCCSNFCYCLSNHGKLFFRSEKLKLMLRISLIIGIFVLLWCL